MRVRDIKHEAQVEMLIDLLKKLGANIAYNTKEMDYYPPDAIEDMLTRVVTGLNNWDEWDLCGTEGWRVTYGYDGIE